MLAEVGARAWGSLGGWETTAELAAEARRSGYAGGLWLVCIVEDVCWGIRVQLGVARVGGGLCCGVVEGKGRLYDAADLDLALAWSTGLR